MRQWTIGWICTLVLAFAAGPARTMEPDPCIPPDTLFALKVRPSLSVIDT